MPRAQNLLQNPLVLSTFTGQLETRRLHGLPSVGLTCATSMTCSPRELDGFAWYRLFLIQTTSPPNVKSIKTDCASAPGPAFQRFSNAIMPCKREGEPALSILLKSGRSVAWLARLFRVQEVVSSNLTA